MTRPVEIMPDGDDAPGRARQAPDHRFDLWKLLDPRHLVRLYTVDLAVLRGRVDLPSFANS